MTIVARLAVVTVALGWTLTASAQEHHAPDHTPSKAAAQAAARPVADATRDAGKHVPPAVGGRTESAKPALAPAPPEPSAKAEGTSAAAEKTPARPTPRPASNKELDVVMDRISRRISQFSGEGGRREGGHNEGGRRPVTPPGETATRSVAAPKSAVRKPVSERVHITWMPTVVWPGALLGNQPAAAAAAGANGDDGAVHLQWNSVQQ